MREIGKGYIKSLTNFTEVTKVIDVSFIGQFEGTYRIKPYLSENMARKDMKQGSAVS